MDLWSPNDQGSARCLPQSRPWRRWRRSAQERRTSLICGRRSRAPRRALAAARWQEGCGDEEAVSAIIAKSVMRDRQQQHSIGRDGVSLRRRGVVGAASTLFKPSWDERLHDKSESDESERVEAEVSKVEVNARRGCASNIELELVAGDIMQSRYEQF